MADNDKFMRSDMPAPINRVVAVHQSMIRIEQRCELHVVLEAIVSTMTPIQQEEILRQLGWTRIAW